MLARKIQDGGISPGKGRFGCIARGPLGQNRRKMLATEAPHGAKMGPEEASTQAKILAARFVL